MSPTLQGKDLEDFIFRVISDYCSLGIVDFIGVKDIQDCTGMEQAAILDILMVLWRQRKVEIIRDLEGTLKGICPQEVM